MSRFRKFNVPTRVDTNEDWESNYLHLFSVLYHLLFPVLHLNNVTVISLYSLKTTNRFTLSKEHSRRQKPFGLRLKTPMAIDSSFMLALKIPRDLTISPEQHQATLWYHHCQLQNGVNSSCVCTFRQSLLLRIVWLSDIIESIEHINENAPILNSVVQIIMII